MGNRHPVDPAGHFRIGSVTKTFTAVAVLQLTGDGALRLDDTVERWLPGKLADGDAVTVRHLLMHTAGRYNYTDAWADRWCPSGCGMPRAGTCAAGRCSPARSPRISTWRCSNRTTTG
ncbi:serine hydrolase domain-containing protein [Catellatospora paridis]|uniref:serine hydrolase domain-containing protein n=1 Tax=Catellatospora paridis TaxID=1617086 RepID=UPI0012D43B29|nr:serine hydrolase domain-containing protein [Catellatospora paridis]